jgi:hypothetical protein
VCLKKKCRQAHQQSILRTGQPLLQQSHQGCREHGQRKDGLLERNVMLTENGNNASMDDKPSEYEASLLQLAVRIEKNQKREEAQRVEAARDKIDKATRLTAKQTESSGGASYRQRTETAIQLVHARVQREEAGRKRGYACDSDDDWRQNDNETMDMDVDEGEGSQVLRRLADDDEVKKNNSKPTHKPYNNEKALQSLRLTKKNKKTFNGAAFAEDVEAEEHDFRATLQQATQERADFAKGLVAVKEYEAHTERLRVEQDKLKVEREEKRKDLQVVWASPVFDSPRALEGCAISRAPAPSDAFATPPDNSINACAAYYNHVFEQGLPLRVDGTRLCNRLCDYCFYLSLFID